MCNLAGYIGRKPAAPILIDMLRKQEGFGGGYQTGIATLSEGKLHYRKVIGAVDELLKQTDAPELPGTVGIIHSRSKEFGDIEWGHPFVNPAENIAYVLNGFMGNFYAGKTNERKIINNLIEQGYKFRTRVNENVPNMPQLEDGSSVHMSEVKCFQADYMRSKCRTMNEALLRAESSYPAEIVGLLLCTETPDSIHAARFNQPLMIGRRSVETFLGTTAMAFPENLDSIVQAPIRSVMEFRRDNFEVSRLPDKTAPIADILPFYEACQIIGEILSPDKGHDLQDLKNAVAGLWPKHMVTQNDMLVYEIMRLFKSQGKIRLEEHYAAGKIAGLKALHQYVYKNDKVAGIYRPVKP
ncbi:MAG: hypothetical protein WCS27_10445 [Victivallaceae bacterium]|jgi:glucosamine--fructose-6-phosphate aminotransferase (isomerizing)